MRCLARFESFDIARIDFVMIRAVSPGIWLPCEVYFSVSADCFQLDRRTGTAPGKSPDRTPVSPDALAVTGTDTPLICFIGIE